MLFNSFVFLPFFAAVTVLHFTIAPRLRWVLQLVASYVFYMAWRPEFAVLIASSTLVDWVVGLRLARAGEPRTRRRLLAFSLAVNLGLLGTFKYLGFLTRSTNAVLEAVGLDGTLPQFDLLLPVGISFYTFQTLSYIIDVWRRKTPPERHLGRFALYVAFWPQLVAGPIERSWRLIPQLRDLGGLEYDRVRSGLLRMAWGFFKKVVVADRLAPFVEAVYDQEPTYGGAATALATVFFAVQIYCDFSGYSDIAIGAARVFGVDLMENFRTPYFAGSIGAFWQRWHVSLSTWFRDYVYIPLGGSRVGRPRWVVNVVVTFVASGLWHGAAWTFVAWGLLHALYMLADAAVFSAVGPGGPSPPVALLRRATTLLAVLFAWILFRAPSLRAASELITSLGAAGGLSDFLDAPGPLALELACAAAALLFAVELALRGRAFEEVVGRAPGPLRWISYFALCTMILWVGKWTRVEFIYFQF